MILSAAHSLLEPEPARVQRRIDLRGDAVTAPLPDRSQPPEALAGPAAHLQSCAVENAQVGKPGVRRPALPFGPGDLLAGRYAIVRKVARGGMGVVYQAVDERRAEAGSVYPYVAIKVANIPDVSAVGARHALHREFARVAGLRHEGIVTVLDFDRQGEHFFLVMEWLDGKTLGKILKGPAAGAGSGWFDRPLSLRLIEDIATALAHAHRQGVVHADIKPANIFLTEEREIKLLDFGNVSIATDRPNGRYFATRAYASCEVLECKEPRASDDVFALGCIAYELLSGRRPFAGSDALEAEALGSTFDPIDGIDGPVWQAIRSALSYRRADRPQDAGLFLKAWRAPVPRPAAARRTSGRRRVAAWTLLAVGVSTGFGTGEIASQSEAEGDPTARVVHAQRPSSEVAGSLATVDRTPSPPVAARRAPAAGAAPEAETGPAASSPDEQPGETPLAAVDDLAVAGDSPAAPAEVTAEPALPAEPPASEAADAAVEPPATEPVDTRVERSMIEAAEERPAPAVLASLPREPARQPDLAASDSPVEVLEQEEAHVADPRPPPGEAPRPEAARPIERVASHPQPAKRRPGESYWLSRVKQRPAEPMSSLNPIRIVAPDYPRSAKPHRGWVDVSFALAPTGQALGIEIHESQPAGVFERSAIDAVRQWRFAGADSGRHVRTRLRFEP